MKSKLKYHLPPVIICLGIFVESSFPTESYPKIDFELSDKIVHFIIYIVLYFALYFSFDNQDKYYLLKKYSGISALFFTMIYGASDEIHQFFVQGRTCDFFDWLADFAGGLIGLIVILISKKYSKNKNNSLNTLYDTAK